MKRNNIDNKLIYNPAGYRNMIKMSSFKYILVEGKDDKTTIKYLIRELFGKRSDIKIHGAHQIEFGSKIGNRERVEEICRSIRGKRQTKRFIGFVDREFRGFELENQINDSIKKHNIIDRLIWSRGNSIENYYFEFNILSKSLRHFSTTEYFEDALDLIEQNLEQIINLACAVGLAGYQCNLLTPIRNSIGWQVLEFKASHIVIKIDSWLNILINKQKIRKEDALKLIDAFQYWFNKVSETDFNIIRWLCDGHTGITFIWAAYACCVFEVSQRYGVKEPQNEATNVLRANETVRFNGCASEWAQQVCKGFCEYPREIFTRLELLD
jgi:5S rRNA maturation endonuclease (ribonuclease M5)